MSRGASLEEIRRVYTQHLSAFVRAATAICGDRDLARDAVHEAFVAAVRARGTYRGAGTVDAWIWSAVVHAARKQLREKVAVPADPDAFDEILTSDDDRSGAELGSVRALIASLPERQRLVLFLRYYGDLGYEQIGRALGIQTGTVSATLYAAHRALRSQLKEVRDV